MEANLKRKWQQMDYNLDECRAKNGVCIRITATPIIKRGDVLLLVSQNLCRCSVIPYLLNTHTYVRNTGIIMCVCADLIELPSVTIIKFAPLSIPLWFHFTSQQTG
jgi:hypothetical protein